MVGPPTDFKKSVRRFFYCNRCGLDYPSPKGQKVSIPGYITAANLGKVWPLFIVVAVVIAFIVFVTLDTKKQIEKAKKAEVERKGKEKQDREQNKGKENK